MKPKIPGQKEGHVKELIQHFEEKGGVVPSPEAKPAGAPEPNRGIVSEAKAKLSSGGKGPFAAGGAADDAPTPGPSRTPDRDSGGTVDIDEIHVEENSVDLGVNGREDAAVAGLKRPEGNIAAHHSTHSTQTPAETGVATQTDPMKSERAIESKPWKGLEKLKECFVGETGMKAGFLKLKKGDIAAGLRDMVTSLVMAPVYAVAMVLDGPRKIGDLASMKGQQLIDGSRGDFKGMAGFKAVLKHFAGGLLQVVGGAVRLVVPVAGLMVLMAVMPPAGWIAGGVLLGFYLVNELGALVNDGVGDLQIVRAGRDLVSGTMGMLGSVVEAVVKPIQAAVGRGGGGAETSESSTEDSGDTISLSDEDDAEIAAELTELRRAELEAAKAARDAEVREAMPEVSGPSVAERIAMFERGDAPEDDE